ncbi:hypothetical protein ACIGCK_11400 [Microbacterium sp. NPDC078428]|uniref:hypothetical protein n=1 Tax=Microbacterium sp. NPDC078428 TaxID=3364190 RepID=UPI0037CB2034
MTDTDPRLDRSRILALDTDLEEVIGLLLGRAINPRQLWLLFLDHDDRLADPIMPCDDYPARPSDRPSAADPREGDAAHVLAHRLAYICEAIGARRAVLVWERRGPRRFGANERLWAAAMATACASARVDLRAQYVLHDRGIRAITPDDYAEPERAR